jgi:hypothetical protein
MGVHVEFDYDAWVALFPEFSEVSAAQASSYFALATIYHRNDGIGPVEDATAQAMYLNLMTAHIAQVFQTENGQSVSEMVGRITSATQGSVTLSTDGTGFERVDPWLAQTKYWLSYWYAMKPYWTFRYIPGPRRFFGPVYGGRPVY